MAKGRFFGKLMGGEEPEEIMEEEALDAEGAVEAPIEQEEEEAALKTKPRPKKSGRAEGEGGEASEEWISEYEGQLTLDVYQTKDNVVIKSTIAGVKSEDLDITIANDMVTIRGERKKDEEVKAEDYFYQECYWGPFSRSIILPVDIDVEGVSAELKDGILTVILPKAAKAKTKKIKVKGTE